MIESTPWGSRCKHLTTTGQLHLRLKITRVPRSGSKKDLSGDGENVDTSGRLPSGESFDGIEELKQILTTSQREAVIRNIVERTLSYALCRKLKVHDQPIVKSITKRMLETDGTWRELFHAVATSVSFRETIISGRQKLDENEHRTSDVSSRRGDLVAVAVS